jgi:signal transduction histidine kinase
MLQTILFNLISNAIKFTPEKENILLEVKIIEDDFIQITVKDSGVGMKEEEVNTLFTADHISKKGTSSEKGTGLGLLLCKEFIQTHRGSLKVESQKDKGSSFIFTLPSSEKVYQNAKP